MYEPSSSLSPSLTHRRWMGLSIEPSYARRFDKYMYISLYIYLYMCVYLYIQICMSLPARSLLRWRTVFSWDRRPSRTSRAGITSMCIFSQLRIKVCICIYMNICVCVCVCIRLPARPLIRWCAVVGWDRRPSWAPHAGSIYRSRSRSR